jgi:hypothetical protein
MIQGRTDPVWEVLFPDGAVFHVHVRLLSVIYGKTGRLREEHAWLGTHCGLDAEAELASCFRELPLAEQMKAAHGLPWGAELACMLMAPGECWTMHDFMNSGGDAVGRPRPVTESRYTQEDWAAARFAEGVGDAEVHSPSGSG